MDKIEIYYPTNLLILFIKDMLIKGREFQRRSMTSLLIIKFINVDYDEVANVIYDWLTIRFEKGYFKRIKR